MTQLTYRHWSRAIAHQHCTRWTPPHQRSHIRLRKITVVVRGVGYQLQLPTAVRSLRRGQVNVILFVFVFGCTIRSNTNRLFVSLFGTEANTKQVFGTALVLNNNVCMHIPIIISCRYFCHHLCYYCCVKLAWHVKRTLCVIEEELLCSLIVVHQFSSL